MPYAQNCLECSFLTHPEFFPVASDLQHCLVSKPLSLSHMQNSKGELYKIAKLKKQKTRTRQKQYLKRYCLRIFQHRHKTLSQSQALNRDSFVNPSSHVPCTLQCPLLMFQMFIYAILFLISQDILFNHIYWSMHRYCAQLWIRESPQYKWPTIT